MTATLKPITLFSSLSIIFILGCTTSPSNKEETKRRRAAFFSGGAPASAPPQKDSQPVPAKLQSASFKSQVGSAPVAETISSPEQQKDPKKLILEHPLLGYLQIRDINHAKKELEKIIQEQKIVSQFLSIFPQVEGTPVPMTLHFWLPIADLRFAIVVPLPKDHVSLKNWVSHWRQQGYLFADVTEVSSHLSVLTLFQSGKEQIQAILANTGGVVPLLQSVQEEDIQLYVNLPPFLEKYGFWFDQKIQDPIRAKIMQPISILAEVLKKTAPHLLEQFQFMKLRFYSKPEEVMISLETQYKNIDGNESSHFTTDVTGFLPSGHLRFMWSTPSISKSTKFPLEIFSELEPPPLLNPLRYLIEQIEKYSHHVEVAGSVSELSPYGINNVLIVSLEDENAARQLLSSLQQAAAWKNDGSVHETRKQEFHEYVHVSIRPSCRKIEGFSVDCYYPRVSNEIDKKKKVFEYPYTYQATRMKNLVFFSWNMDKNKTTESLDQVVRFYLGGKKQQSLQSQQLLQTGGYLYVDIHQVGAFLSLLGFPENEQISAFMKKNPVLLSGYRDGKARLYKLVIPRGLLSLSRSSLSPKSN